MKELLIFIAKNLVEFPDEVSVTEVEKENGSTLELRVAPSDMGRVIGRHGRVAREIRTLVKSVAIRENKWINVDIIESATEETN